MASLPVTQLISSDKQISAVAALSVPHIFFGCHSYNPFQQPDGSGYFTRACFCFPCMYAPTHASNLHMGSRSPSLSLSLLSGPMEKPHLYDDIQHRIKAHVRPSSAYTATAKRGSIQPHTLMQPCTHTGRETTGRAHTQVQ